MSIYPVAFLPSEIRSSSKLGSCQSDPRRFRCLPNTAVVERDALGAPTHRSLWGGTQDPSPFTYLRELSNRFGSMRVCAAQAVLAINHAFMTSVSMPSPGLCRISFKYVGWRGSDRFLVRHNQSPSRKANSLSSGR